MCERWEGRTPKEERPILHDDVGRWTRHCTLLSCRIIGEGGDSLLIHPQHAHSWRAPTRWRTSTRGRRATLRRQSVPVELVHVVDDDPGLIVRFPIRCRGRPLLAGNPLAARCAKRERLSSESSKISPSGPGTNGTAMPAGLSLLVLFFRNRSAFT